MIAGVRRFLAALMGQNGTAARGHIRLHRLLALRVIDQRLGFAHAARANQQTIERFGQALVGGIVLTRPMRQIDRRIGVLLGNRIVQQTTQAERRRFRMLEQLREMDTRFLGFAREMRGLG